jgi:hypothetical protein
MIFIAQEPGANESLFPQLNSEGYITKAAPVYLALLNQS